MMECEQLSDQQNQVEWEETGCPGFLNLFAHGSCPGFVQELSTEDYLSGEICDIELGTPILLEERFSVS